MTKDKPFAQSITELEGIVSRLEKGDFPLEEALQQFEQGIHLVKTCQMTLQQVEQKIEYLSAQISKSEETEVQHD